MRDSGTIRTRWAAIGAALAVALGAGGIGLVDAAKGSGDRAVYTAIEPCRLLDTRPNKGVGGRTSPLGPAEVYPLTAHGNNGECVDIPSDTVALELNVTGLLTTGATHFTIWDGLGGVPNASHLNLTAGHGPVPNSVTTDLNGAGFAIFNNSATAHAIIDIVGIYQHHTHDDRYYTREKLDRDHVWTARVRPDGTKDGTGPYTTSRFGVGHYGVRLDVFRLGLPSSMSIVDFTTVASPWPPCVSAAVSGGGGGSTKDGMLATITPNIRTYDQNGASADCGFSAHIALDDPNPRFINP